MELEELRQKKLAELRQQRMQEAMQEKFQMQQQIEQLYTGARMWMDAEALSRYGNIKAAHPEKALQVAVLIAQFVQSGKIHKLITDEQLKELLIYLDGQKKLYERSEGKPGTQVTRESKVKIQRK